MNKIRTTKAFTLIEVLVATVMIAILAVSLYTMLYTGFQIQQAATGSLAQMRKVSLLMDSLQQDVASILPPGGVLRGPFIGQSFVDGVNDAMVFYNTARAVPDPNWTGNILELVGDVQEVEIYCNPAEDGKSQTLLRRVTHNLLSPTMVERQPEVLCRGIASFNLRYFDGTAWQNTWDSTVQGNNLPAAIEVSLQLADKSDRGVAHGPRIIGLLLPMCGQKLSTQTIGAVNL
jgi:prepilin-type N-terminal cleavage/methylation domain-containing protein